MARIFIFLNCFVSAYTWVFKKLTALLKCSPGQNLVSHMIKFCETRRVSQNDRPRTKWFTSWLYFSIQNTCRHFFFGDILVLFPKTSELITYNYDVLSESKIQEIDIMGLFFI